MTSVSVLMPVYNTEESFLRESIESILNQTYQDFELIIIDDGSSNDIYKIIESYQDRRIRFYKNEINLGVAKTRNKLLELAEGEYVAFQDSDDISLPNRLAKQVEFLNSNKEISILGCDIETIPNKKKLKKISNPKILDFLGGCAVANGSVMLRLEDLKKHKLKYNETCVTSEDYELWSRAIKYLYFENLQEVLYKYRENPNSLVHTKGNFGKEIDTKIKQNLLNYLSGDEKLKEKIINLVSSHFIKKATFAERLFSIRNEWYGARKYKIIQILGIKLKLAK